MDVERAPGGSTDDRTARSLRRKLIAAIAILAIVVVVVTRPADEPSFVATGEPAALPPVSTLTELSADHFERVLVGLRGTPVIVNVWASWCAPCRTEARLLERTWREHRSDVMILGVASKDGRSEADAFVDEFAMTYPNIFDSSGDIRSRLGLRGFPTTYVFGVDGRLRTTIVGGLTEQRLASVLVDLES